MTMEEFWKSWLSFWFLAGPLILSLIHIIYNLYLIYFHLDAIKDALKNSRSIYMGKQGLMWSGLDMAIITGMIMAPKIHIRAGKLDPVDFEKFPPRFKRLLKIHIWIMCIWAVWLVIACILLKLR